MTPNNDFIRIRCPKCGYEYTLADIFYPEDILGKPNNIIRDDSGKIILVEGSRPSLSEEFECDKCGTHFKTALNVVVETQSNEQPESEDFVITLSDKEKLF